jgi:hypothetical protein
MKWDDTRQRASDRVSERGRLAGALRQRADRHPHHPAKNKLFLCLSRACLAKMINFGIQVAQGRRFPAPRCFHLPSRRHRRRRLLAWRLAAVAARPPFHSSAAGRGRSCCSLLSGSAPAASAARRSSPDHPPIGRNTTTLLLLKRYMFSLCSSRACLGKSSCP